MSDVTLHHGDCLDVMATLPDSSVALIVADPPYHRVKDEDWDRQWPTEGDYLTWIGRLCDEWRRVLRPSGSLYCFASPRMAARVEVEVGKRFEVLNSIVWTKADETTHALKYGDDRFRLYVQKSERIIFAEHFGADSQAKGEAGWEAKCDEVRGFVFEPLRAYLAGERDRAGFTTRKVAEAFQQKTGSRTVTGMAGHWFERVQWELPTAENYEWLRDLFNAQGDDHLRREYEDLRREYEDLRREYEDLRREYEDLRREYEDLRREYEDLRRPFSVDSSVPYTDVWDFPTVPTRPDKHPCEKSSALIAHIVKASSRPGDLVLDPCAGSGVTGEVCRALGRECILIEKDSCYCEMIRWRLAEARIGFEIPHVARPAKRRRDAETPLFSGISD
jgi:adenine-specific DNA-methyltransferase